MFLVSPRLGSPGSRYRMHLRLPPQPRLESPTLPSRLTCGFLSAAGRARSGEKTIWSKGKRYANRRYVAALASASGARLLGLVCAISWQPKTRAALGLVKNSIGAWFFTPLPRGVAPLSYFSAMPRNAHAQTLKGAHPTWWWPLALLAPYTRASLFPTRHGLAPQLVCSPGSTALVLTASLWRQWALIVLPSGQLFLCKNTPHVLLGGRAPTDSHGQFSTVAGARRRRGFAPSVRGVAMNPNDHPHGGRTKAVKYPRTP
jgi:large subunit ribosomal protein L2